MPDPIPSVTGGASLGTGAFSRQIENDLFNDFEQNFKLMTAKQKAQQDTNSALAIVDKNDMNNEFDDIVMRTQSIDLQSMRD